MKTTHFMRQCVKSLIFGFGLFAFALGANATTVADPAIANVTATPGSTTLGATTSYELTFTTTEAIAVGGSLTIQASTQNCPDGNWESCNFDFSNASVSGLNGSIDQHSDNMIGFLNAEEITAGEHTITVANVQNPNTLSVYRFYLSSPSSDHEDLSNDDYLATKSNPVVLGDALAYGTITDPDSNPLQLYGEVHDQQYQLYQGFNSDEWGYYAVANPGFTAGGQVEMNVMPAQNSGLFNTSASFTYAGSAVLKDVTVQAASKTVSGTIKYDDNSAVTNAGVNANAKGSWDSANVDSNGAFSMMMVGGEYEVCLGDKYDENGQRQARDWYADQGQQCQFVSFQNDTSAESKTINFVVHRADALITGVFKNPDGSYPENGGWVSVWNDQMWFGGDVDSQTGQVNIAVMGGNSQNISATSLHVRSISSTSYKVDYSPRSSDEHTYWNQDKITVNANQTLNLGTVTLAERDVVYTVTVKDENNHGVEDIDVNAWQEKGGWNNVRTDENGQAQLYLYAGTWNIQPSLGNSTSYLYAGKPETVTVASGDTGSLSFNLTTTTLTVGVKTLTEDGAVASVRGWVNCWSQGSNYGFGGNVQNGIGSFGAVGGNYNCNLWVDDQNYQASGESQVTFVDGQNTELIFTLLARTANIHVYVKDADNNLVSDGSARVFANSSEGGGRSEGRLENGESNIAVAPGKYDVGVWFENKTSYVTSMSFGEPLELADGEDKTKTLTVYAVTATFTATLKDSEGNPVPNAWVGCGNWPEMEGKPMGDFDKGKIIESGSESGGDGMAVVGLVKGHEYECWVGVNSDFSDLIGPGSQQIDLTKKDSASAEFVFQKADSKIKGTVSFAKSVDRPDSDIQRVFCNGWADEGYNSWDDGFGQEYSLNTLQGTWHVWCGTDILNDDGTRDFYETEGDTLVNIKKSGTYTQDIKLKKSMFQIPESFTETFDSTQPKTIILDDGQFELNIPANAIPAGETSNNITVTIEPELNAMKTATYSPWGFPRNIEVYDSDGSLVSGNFNSSVTLTLYYSQDILNSSDISEDAVLPKYWDEDQGAWKDADSVSQKTITDEDTEGSVTFTLQHFSQVGLVYNNKLLTQNAKPGKARKLSAKKITVNTARLTWKKPFSSTVTKYKVQLRPYQIKQTNKWDKFNKVKKQPKRKVKRKIVEDLTTGTRYQFRVKVCNRSMCSAFTKWKAFTTKTE